MGFRITWMWILGAALCAVGCALRGQMDILESRLRQQEDSVNQLQAQLSTAQSQLQAARRESADLRTQLADGTRTARVEQVSALGQVEAIELNRYLTGGLDRDGIPGDELLSVLIVPTDSQGNLVKAPGSVSLAVFDLSKPESQQRIGRWDFTPQKSDSLWVSGFLGKRLCGPRSLAGGTAVGELAGARPLENDRRPPIRYQPVDPHCAAQSRPWRFAKRRRRQPERAARGDAGRAHTRGARTERATNNCTVGGHSDDAGRSAGRQERRSRRVRMVG